MQNKHSPFNHHNSTEEFIFAPLIAKINCMKRISLIAICCLPLLSYSQQTGTLPAVKTHSANASKIDTMITKDPLESSREFWVIHNLRGNVRYRGFMLNGKKDGVWREYSESSGLMTRLTEYKNGIPHGATVSYGQVGNIEREETFLNGKKNGEAITYIVFGGKMKVFETFKDDILDGARKLFYEDGKIQEEGSYQNGQRNGLVKWFKQNGNPTLEYSYENGVLKGPAKVYDENGKLKQEGAYLNNIEEGEWKEYNDSVLVKKIIYKGGQIVKEIPVKK